MERNYLLIIILIILLCIVIYQFVYCIEKFETTSKPNPNTNPNTNLDNTPTLYIFISKTCPHCVTYVQETHPILVKALANTNIKLKLIYADEDPDDLFGKFGVQYVPTFYCVKGVKKIKVEQVDQKSLIDQFNSM